MMGAHPEETALPSRRPPSAARRSVGRRSIARLPAHGLLIWALAAPAAAQLSASANDAAAPSPPPREIETVPAEVLERAAPLVPESPAAADAAARGARPRLGLALGGGGARGFAHVGVLKVLEELRVPVDCIAGTSMGAVVGALYAAGMTPAQIESALVALDWSDVFSDRPRRQDRSLRRKQDDRADLFDLELGFAGGEIVLPRGLVAGQKFAFALSAPELLVPPDGGFDGLPTPFRAVATDLRTGEAIAVTGGDLLRAIRASMAVPGVFPPVEMDGRLLADGGLSLNVPVSVARSMGADVVIAVDVVRPLDQSEPDELKTLPGIVRQVGALLSKRTSREQLARAQLVISPPLDDLSSSSFGRGAWAVARAEEATRALAQALAPYALTPEAHAEHLAARSRRPPPPLRVVAVDVVNTSGLDDWVVESRLGLGPASRLDWRELERGLGRVWELGLFESVEVQLRPYGQAPAAGPDRPWRLGVLARERNCGPTALQFGLSLRDDFAGDATYDLRARWTRHALNPLGGELRVDGAAGSSPNLSVEWYQPFSYDQASFLALRGETGAARRALYAEGERLAEYRLRRDEARAELGRVLGNRAELRGGLVYGRDEAWLRTGEADVSTLSGRHGGYAARLTWDSLDDRGFPKRGLALDADWYRAEPQLAAPRVYDRAQASLRGYATAGLNTFWAAAEGGSDLRTVAPAFDWFRLGGLFSFSGYREGELAGRAYGVGRAGYWRAINPRVGALRPRHHLGVWLEAGDAWADAREATLRGLRWSVTLALGAKTPVGPVYLAWGRADDNSQAWYLSIGRKMGAGH